MMILPVLGSDSKTINLGGWHGVAVNQVKKLAVAKARQKGEDQGDSVRRLFQLISVLLAKGNASLFLSRDPTLLSQEPAYE